MSEVLATGARLAGAALQAAEVASLAGLTVVAGTVNLVLLPPSRDSITPLGDGQRFVARPGELYGSLQVLDGDGHWQTVATNVRLVLNGNVRQALSDEEIARLTRPLINVPPPAHPGSPPPLLPTQPDDGATLPGQPIDTPRPPDLQGLPIADPPSIDDIIITRNADKNSERATERHSANPDLADPSALVGKTGPNGVGVSVYPDQPAVDSGAGYEEERTGKPSGISINVGGTVGTTASGNITAVGGVNFDGARVDANGRTVLNDAKDWGNFVLPEERFWVDKVVGPAREQVRAVQNAGVSADIEWQVSTERAAAEIAKALRSNGVTSIRVVWVPKKGP